jgi:MraZ protein
VAFRGQYEHSLDSKDRLTVPARFREDLTDRPVVVKGPDNCLWLMPEKSFDTLSDQYIESHSPFGRDARKLRRLFNSGASECEVDSAGRIRIPKHLLESAGLQASCTVIGAGTYVEIWETAAWQTENEKLQAEFGDIAEGMSGSGG